MRPAASASAHSGPHETTAVETPVRRACQWSSVPNRAPDGRGVRRQTGRVFQALHGVAVVLFYATTVLAQKPPVPDLVGPVNDFAKVIDPASAAEIERISRDLQRATGDAVVVVTVPSVAPFADLREYAVEQFANNGRGLGERGKDNGALIVLAVSERRVWIEVGYGLEGAIPDGFAGETSRDYMAPAFREGDYGRGLLAGVVRLVGRIAEERNVRIEDLPALAAPRTAVRHDSRGGIPAVVIILVIIALAVLLSGGGGGPSLRRRRGSTLWTGGSTGGWGGGSFGGGFRGGSFGGGGFGGFGGGRSGGGGGGAGW
jgi:uncharacterized protein